MNLGYARVSTKDQAVDLQVDALKQAVCVKVYTEVISGARAHRPVLEGLRAFPPRNHERRGVMQEAANLYGVSE